jgi:phosphate transport system substrate-binding protein
MNNSSPDDDFLHRLREAPSRSFLSRLKREIDRPSARDHARSKQYLVHSSIIALLLAAAGFAITTAYQQAVRPVAPEPAVVDAERVVAPSRAVVPEARSVESALAPATPPPGAPATETPAPPAIESSVGSEPGGAPEPAAQWVRGEPALPSDTWVTPPATRDYVVMTGSRVATVFSESVAERFSREKSFPRPDVTVSGTGGGFSRFCAGIGGQYPDIVNASRRIRPDELQRCVLNGAGEMVEIAIGHLAVVVVRSEQRGSLELSLRDLFVALVDPVALDGPSPRSWNGANRMLPREPIEFLGPSRNSLLGEIFPMLVMEKGCTTTPAIENLHDTDFPRYQKICTAVRDDGAYVEAFDDTSGPSPLIDRVASKPGVLGIVDFQTYLANTRRLAAARINGIAPTLGTITGGTYPASGEYYFYVKSANLALVPGIREFLLYYLQQLEQAKTWPGFIPGDRAKLSAARAQIEGLTVRRSAE